jgi:hypothetical protein
MCFLIDLDPKVTTPAIATTISVVVSVSVSYLINRKNNYFNEERRIDEMLNQINMISIQYPYLEDRKFILEWGNNKDSSDDKFLRYDSYCIIVFNYLERLSAFYNYKTKKIERNVHISEIIKLHSEWWKSPTGDNENIEGYSKKFRIFVQKYIK